VVTLCLIAKVSKSGYYKWKQRQSIPHKDSTDRNLVEKLFVESNRKAGWRTIRMLLQRTGICMNHKKIQRIMRELHLYAEVRRYNPYKQTQRKSILHKDIGNVLNRKFTGTTPYTAFSTDMTYIHSSDGFVYLSVMKDIFTGEIASHEVSRHPSLALVMNTVTKLTTHSDISSLGDSLIHSDQGFQYTTALYIQELQSLGITQSMSRRGKCIDNAPVESFFGHMKDEVFFSKNDSFTETCAKIDTYIQHYNQQRPQWNRNKMTPIEYRDHLLEQNR
jgi:putative transposase